MPPSLSACSLGSTAGPGRRPVNPGPVLVDLTSWVIRNQSSSSITATLGGANNVPVPFFNHELLINEIIPLNFEFSLNLYLFPKR
jgi:hypothetical protein